jgi:hypothetical protein
VHAASVAELPHAVGQHSDPCGRSGAPAAAHSKVGRADDTSTIHAQHTHTRPLALPLPQIAHTFTHNTRTAHMHNTHAQNTHNTHAHTHVCPSRSLLPHRPMQQDLQIWASQLLGAYVVAFVWVVAAAVKYPVVFLDTRQRRPVIWKHSFNSVMSMSAMGLTQTHALLISTVLHTSRLRSCSRKQQRWPWPTAAAT